MMTDRELMQQALSALVTAELDGNCEYGVTDSLRARLAQPEPAECDGGQCGIGGYCKQCPKTQPDPEPVAWISHNAGLYHGKPDESLNPLPLYTAPPQREWVGLTDEQKKEICQEAANEDWTDLDVINATEAKLREKNG